MGGAGSFGIRAACRASAASTAGSPVPRASWALVAPLAETLTVTPETGYPYHIDIYRDADGCRVVEQVRIEEMAHYWPGGSDDPSLAGFTDPRAPSGAALSWAFFKRFRRSDTTLPCAEAGP